MPAVKRLVFLNRSFFPDVEATGQLLTELCEELADYFDVHVICGKPLYRKVENRKLIDRILYKKITIWRINNTTFPKKCLIGRLINLFSYFILCTIWTFFLKKASCIIAETDPPLLAVIAYVYSRIHHSSFIYYSQDIWPEVGIVNRGMTNPVITRILRVANKFLYRKATRIVVPGRAMKRWLEEKHLISSHKIEVVENWADPNQIFPIKNKDNILIKSNYLDNKFVIMYSGNIGLSQDLENIVFLAEALKDIKDIIFLLIGEGAIKEKLMKMTASLGLKNIKFLPYQEKKHLRFSLNAAHIHLIPLKKGMKGIIVPSKVYGIMASGRPFIAAVDEGSEIDRIIKKFNCGLAVRPSDLEGLKKAVLWAFKNRDKIEEMGKNGRKALESHYSRKICTQKFKRIVEEII